MDDRTPRENDEAARSEARHGPSADLPPEQGSAAFDPATTTSDDDEAMVVPEAVEGGALEIEDLTTDPAAPDAPDG
jgi:hypothetical protein